MNTHTSGAHHHGTERAIPAATGSALRVPRRHRRTNRHKIGATDVSISDAVHTSDHARPAGIDRRRGNR